MVHAGQPDSTRDGLGRDQLIWAKLVMVCLDLTVLVSVFLVLARVAGPMFMVGDGRVAPSASLLLLLAAVPPVWSQFGLYRIVTSRRLRQLVARSVLGTVVVLGAILTLIAAFEATAIRRLHLLAVAGVVLLWLVCSRRVATILAGRSREPRRGAVSRLLVVGDGIGAQRFLATVTGQPELGLQPIGFLGGDASLPEQPRLGGIGDIDAVLTQRVIDEVVICLPFEQWPLIRHVAQTAEEQGKKVRIPLWMAEQLRSRSRVDKLGGVPQLAFVSTPDDVIQNGFKRTFDVVGALAGLLVFSPVILVAAAVARFTDRGPVFFSQDRIGLNGRVFRMLKLRTMTVDAEERLAEVQHLNTRDGITFKATNDPRITRFGRVLRRTSLDEVPQFLNVLRGDMSIVGPRPALRREVDLYNPAQRRRLSVKPGITGLWQVEGRAESTFESWVEKDLAYIDDWRPWHDLAIMARTVGAMARRTGE